MAYLSDVTHKMLVGKHQPALGIPAEYQYSDRYTKSPEGLVTPEDAGISISGEFIGGIRCMEVHRTPGCSIDNMQVWTGEQDGALCVRDGLGHGRFTIEKKKKVFVSALLCHGWDSTPGRFMYAGMSDGYLRVYDQIDLPDGGKDYEMVCEIKKHTAGITCMLSVRELIITGGRDWQIFMWRWDGIPGAGGQFRAFDQFWGHQNAVRCLTFDQGPDRLLYSGGDDCSIKCLELETGNSRSVPGGFPIEGHQITRHGHKGGIRALVVYERYLFSASEDGSIKVWDSQDGTFVKTMFKCPPGRETAVLTLLKDPAGGRVWSGGADGIIRIFNAYDHVQITQIEDPHNGAMVTGLATLGRLNAIKGWYVTKEGVCKVLYSESDAPDKQIAPTTENEVAMIKEVARLRTVTLQGFEGLGQREKAASRYQRISEKRKEALKRVVDVIGDGSLKRKYFGKMLLWLQAHKNQVKRRELSHLMAATNDQLLAHLYFKKLARYLDVTKDAKRRMRFAHCLLASNTNGLQILYYRKLLEWVRRNSSKTHRRDIVDCLRKSTTKGMTATYYHTWVRWSFKHRQARKREALCESLRNCSKKGLMVTYYYKLIHFYRKESALQKNRELSNALLATHDNGLRHVYLNKCLHWLDRQVKSDRKKKIAASLLRSTNEGMRRAYLGKARVWLTEHKKRKVEDKIEEIDNAIDEVNRKLSESTSLSDADIERLTREVSDEMEALEAEMEKMEAELLRLEEERKNLLKELRNVGRPSVDYDSSENATKQAMSVVAYLKAHGVNCKSDIGAVNGLHEKRKKGEDPVTVFSNGFKRVKDTISSLCQREGVEHDMSKAEWEIPQDIVSLLDRKPLEIAHTGIKEMVIAADQMVDPKINREAIAKIERGPVAKQILLNQNVLMDIVIKIYEKRIVKELRAMGPKMIAECGLGEARFGSIDVASLNFEEEVDVQRAETPPPMEESAEQAPPQPAEAPRPKRAPRATAGYKFSPDLKITEIGDGSPASKAGLKVGDVITAVGQTSVKDKKQYAAAIKKIRPGDPMAVTFRRGARSRTTSINMS
eukprot:TRINITY_DN6223_c1_g1_i1.p1 TRINITY_DN6223_c1_g1~~TRINITY_DN6223_c1_g1_i1.p1  ORF type:complete len:1058 (+),score=365.58 TRINITY_DN6223_c1_g1_i1:102-3275(+)